jgi:hypothetical protein
LRNEVRLFREAIDFYAVYEEISYCSGFRRARQEKCSSAAVDVVERDCE